MLSMDQAHSCRDAQPNCPIAEGETLSVADSGSSLWVTDQKGNTARVTIPDVYQSNGIIMVVDKVLMP